MTKSFTKFRKPCFCPIFGPFSQILGQKSFFPENSALSGTTSYGFLEPNQNSEKLMIKFQENVRTEGRTEGRTELILSDPSGYLRGSNKPVKVLKSSSDVRAALVPSLVNFRCKRPSTYRL